MKFYSLDLHSNYVDFTKTKPIVLPAEAQVVYPALPPPNVQKQVGVTVVDLARRSLKKIKLKEYVNNSKHRVNTVVCICCSINDQYNGPYYKKNFVLHAAKLGDDCVVVVDGHGLVQILETGHFALHE